MVITKDSNKNIEHYLSEYCFQTHFPHEMIFAEALLKYEFVDSKVAEEFVAFVYQYYPEYSWRWVNDNNLQDKALAETHLNYLILLRYYKFNDVEVSNKDRVFAMMFGEMATEFCIRNRGYSLVGCGGSDVIITAKDNYSKSLGNYLEEGFCVHKISKIYYVPNQNDSLGHFEELPCLPLGDSFNCNDEYIEDRNHNLVKVQKYN